MHVPFCTSEKVPAFAEHLAFVTFGFRLGAAFGF
jgi:hypothetical protein